VLDLIAPACKANGMETKMDCNPKCEKPYKLHKHNQSHSICIHILPRFFLLHQGYQDSDSNIIAIVIMNSNSRSSAPQHQHTTMDGNKNSSNSFASIEFKASFRCQTFTCITCGSLSPSSSNVPISKCHSNTSLIFQSSNHSLSLSLSTFFLFLFLLPSSYELWTPFYLHRLTTLVDLGSLNFFSPFNLLCHFLPKSTTIFNTLIWIRL